MEMKQLQIRRLDSATNAEITAMADVLLDCIEGGGSVGFMQSLSREEAEAFWRDLVAAAGRGERALLVAEDASGIVGTAALILDLPANQPHRADLTKVLVHRKARRHGAGMQLLQAAEATAREVGKNLLVLDTVTGATAERLYERAGWKRVGVIPRYALYPDGASCATTVFYKDLLANR